MMTYDDFVVRIGSQKRDGKHHVQVLTSPFGEGEDHLELPDPSTFEGPLRDTPSSLLSTTGPRETLEMAGQRLFTALFSGKPGELFQQSLGKLQGDDPQRGLRILIRFNPDDAESYRLQALPWEILHHRGAGHLGLSPRTPIVRYAEINARAPDRPPERPLQVLVLVADPAGVDPLDAAGEQRQIEAALAPLGDVEATVRAATSLAALREHLRSKSYHVLHFIGHGDVDPATGRGQLLFGARGQPARPVDAASLALALDHATSLRMVVLNACASASVEHPGLSSSLAGALVAHGIPAVVAMRRSVSDTAAIAFSQALYQRLSARDPVESAVAEGRRAVLEAVPESTEWVTPVLYLRAGASRLFAVEEQGSPAHDPTRPGRFGRRTRAWTFAAVAVVATLLTGAASWKRPTSIELELVTRRFTFTVDGAAPQELLSPAVVFRRLSILDFDSIRLEPARFFRAEATDPRTRHALPEPGEIVVRSRDGETARLDLAPQDPTAGPLGLLDRLWLAPGSEVTIETDAVMGEPPSDPAVTIAAELAEELDLSIFEALELTADLADLESPRGVVPGSRFQVELEEPRHRIELCCAHRRIHLVVEPGGTSPMFSDRTLRVVGLELLQQGLTGNLESSLLTDGRLRYPEAPGRGSLPIDRRQVLELVPGHHFQIRDLSLDPQTGGLRVTVVGIAEAMRGVGDPADRDFRLSWLDVLLSAVRLRE